MQKFETLTTAVTTTTREVEKYLKLWLPTFMPAAKSSARTQLGPIVNIVCVTNYQKKGPIKIFKIGETPVWKFCIRSKLSELRRFLPNLSTHFAQPKCLALTPSNHIMRLWENSGERG